MNTQKFVIFTDLKDFTYKNALLTDAQIEEILGSFEELVKASAKKNDIQLVKSIGDAYLALGNTALSAYSFAKEIVASSLEYDSKQKIEIKEIGLRVTLTYGMVSKKQALDQEDYFGECINLGSRMMSVTPKGAIFCTNEFYGKLDDVSIKGELVGEFEFHGVLYKTKVQSLGELSKQQKEELSDTQRGDEKTLLKECDELVFRSACVAALISLQPIPLLDSYNIIGVQLYMIVKLSAKFEHEINMKSASQIFLEIVSPLSLSYISLQGISTAAKIMLPGLGGYLIAPASFAVSYALGKIYTAYFYYNRAGQKIPKEDIKLLFSKQRGAGQNMAKHKKKEIFSTGKDFYKEVLSVKSESGFSEAKSDIIKMLKKK